MTVDVLHDGRGGVKPAGVVYGPRRLAEGGAADCLTLGDRPVTPPELSKWRRSQVQPGQRVQHPGLRDDAHKYNNPYTIHGDSSVAESDHVPDVWCEPGAKEGLGRLKQTMAEKVYKSTKTEPIGKSLSRGHNMPTKTTAKDFKFGVSSAASENVKGLLYPPPEEPNAAAEELYRKSHRSYGPGEQVRRGYDTWNVDKSSSGAINTVFGRPAGTKALNGTSENVTAAIQMKGDHVSDDSVPAQTRLTSKKLEDFRQLQNALGRARNLGQDSRTGACTSAAHVYGKAAQRRGKDEWDARACIEGDYTVDQQQPDSDLGKSITPGFRNVTNEDRAFGVPAIRSDIPAPARRSVADSQNYGDSIGARYLVNPGQFSSLGVEDDEFFMPRSKAELYDLLQHVGCDYPADVFDVLFEAAAGGAAAAAIADIQVIASDYDEAVCQGYVAEWRQHHQLQPLQQ